MAEFSDSDEWAGRGEFLTRIGRAVPPWALLIWIAGQGAASIWWAAKMDERMSRVETAQATMQADHTTLARVDDRVDRVAVVVDRIDQRLSEDERGRTK